MSTSSLNAVPFADTVPPDVMADTEAVLSAVAAGKKVDAEVAQRVQERAAQARANVLRTHGVQDIGVSLIREARGPLDEERELTLTQCDLLRRGERRLIDPETGTIYILVPEDEYTRLTDFAR